VQAAVQVAYGSIDQCIQIKEVATPVPERTQVVVRVAGATVNRKDLFALQNLTGPGIRARPPLPHINGTDAWGEVAAVGPEVTDWAVGEVVVVYPGLYCNACEWCLRGEQSAYVHYRVLGEQVAGSHAEYVLVEARNLERVPPGVPLDDLVAACGSWLTAWRALIRVARVQPGESVLIVGASGGVGSGAIRIATLAGCRTIAVAAGEDKLRRALEEGAEATIDYSRGEFQARARDITGGRGVDVVLDSVGAATWRQSINALAPFGRMVVCGATSGDVPGISVREVYQQHRRILGTPIGSRSDLRNLLRVIAEGALKPIVHADFPLDEMHAALRLLESRRAFGKIVINP